VLIYDNTIADLGLQLRQELLKQANLQRYKSHPANAPIIMIGTNLTAAQKTVM
jgi:hypothetical protein